jgi:type VI protein secretion system component VasF
MNDNPRVDLHSSIKAPSSSVPTSRKVATWLLAAIIVLVMIVWFGFLGWGAVATLEWLLGAIKNL